MTNKKAKKKPWLYNYAKLKDGRIIYDKDVAKHAFKHLKFLDRFDINKIASAIIWSQTILFGSVGPEELPKKKNWKYFKDF